MSEIQPLFYEVFPVMFFQFLVRMRGLNFTSTALTSFVLSLIYGRDMFHSYDLCLSLFVWCRNANIINLDTNLGFYVKFPP